MLNGTGNRSGRDGRLASQGNVTLYLAAVRVRSGSRSTRSSRACRCGFKWKALWITEAPALDGAPGWAASVASACLGDDSKTLLVT
jgi:hypothetical protein